MTINRNGQEKFNRTLQANSREIQTSFSKPQLQVNSKPSSNQLIISSHFREQPQLPPKRNQEQRDNMMMTRPTRQSRPTTANNNNNLGPNPPRSKPLTATNRHPTPAASQMTPQQQQQQQQPQQEVWNSTEDLFWDHMREVQNKWNTLKFNDDIWAKLIYFEQNRRLAKAYVSTPVLTIDGSTNGLDGFRIGLSGIENSYRNLDSIACLRSIGQGIKLKIDQQGNILIRKLVPVLKAKQMSSGVAGGCPVWVKEWPKPPKEHHSDGGDGDSSELNTMAPKPEKAHQPIGLSASSSTNSDYSQLSSCSSSSTPSQKSYDSHRSTSSASSGQNNSPSSFPSDWLMQEIKDPEQTYKLFDMQKFRLQLERTKRRAARNQIDGTTTTPIDWRQCVSIISFDCAGPPTGNGRSSRLLSQPQPAVLNSKQQQVLSDPCWLMLINIIAIDMLKSSVCDSTPSPGSQTSTLVNRYQNDNMRAAARKLLPPLPALDRPLDNERDQVRVNLPTYRNQVLDQAEVKSTSAAPDLVGYKSERLKRLNQIRYQAQPEQMKSLSGKKQQQQSQAPMLPHGQAQHSPKSHQQQHQQTEGSIYTTFTGKYLDKQHRMRANKQRSSSTMVAPIGQSSVNDFDLERGPHLIMSKLNRRDANYQQDNQANRGDNSRPIYPISSARPGRKLPGMTTSNWLTHSRPVGARSNQQLTHSLSAFDLSHGLKLNLRSINASSIKMNFDDDEDEDEEFVDDDFHNVENDDDDNEDQGLQMDSEHTKLSGRSDLFAKLHLKPKEKTLIDLVRGQQKIRSSKVMAQNSEASSEWINLAKKFSLLANSSEQNVDEHKKSDQDGEEFIKSMAVEQNQLNANNRANRKEPNDVQEQHSDSNEPLSKSCQEELEDDSNKLQQNVSRSSIASSTSSGCVDNDYFISQSSPSSMSSSTRSNGEELSSQPASSSGIISGNASDDYERRQMKPADEELGSGTTNRNAQENQASKSSRLDSHTKQQQQQQQSNSTNLSTSNSRPKSKEGQLTSKMNQQRHRSPARKQAISLSRGDNGKSVDLNPRSPLDVAACQDCENLSQTIDQCDCGASSCDQMVYAVNQGPSNGICDCFCDCLYHPNEVLTGSMEQQKLFVHPTRCQDELLCDCDQNVGPMSPSRQLDMDDEDPIYDHLPRFGLTSRVSERLTSKTSSNSTRHKVTTRNKSSDGPVTRRSRDESRSRETINDEDYDCIVPLPMSGVDRDNSRLMMANGMDKLKGKSISATNLKRTSGWLEGNKYIKLLPRFMSFASSSSSTSSNYANGKQNRPLVKSGTLDRATQMVNKFRRTRSSQNLSK